MTRVELLQTLHNVYNVVAQLHNNIDNCVDITDKQRVDLIESSYELEEIIRCMLCEFD